LHEDVYTNACRGSSSQIFWEYPVKDESHISKWSTYAEYFINLCITWSDESFPSFERSAKVFC
jgi:hypothetical protein